MSLFPEIDKNKTITNVREFFEKDLPMLEQTAGTFLKSVQLTSQPSGNHNTNATLDMMTRQVWARDQLDKVAQTLPHMPEQLRQILELRYFDKLTWQAIEERCYISERTGQNRIRQAFLYFAYGYHGEAQLLVEKEQGA